MNDPEQIPAPLQRAKPIHQAIVECSSRSSILFLTVCTKNRQPILAKPEMHATIRKALLAADHWLVGRYVIMPDHIHLFCALGKMPTPPLSNWVRFWKTSVSIAAKCEPGKLWQRDFWDTQLRGHESYESKWTYVRDNPVRAGLCGHDEAWSFQGELNVLRWHD